MSIGPKRAQSRQKDHCDCFSGKASLLYSARPEVDRNNRDSGYGPEGRGFKSSRAYTPNVKPDENPMVATVSRR